MSMSLHCVSSNWDLEVNLTEKAADMDKSGSQWNVNDLKKRNIAVELVSVDRQVQWLKDTYTRLFASAFEEELRFEKYTKWSFDGLASDALSLIDNAQRIDSENEQFVAEFVQCVLMNTFHPYQV